MLYRAPIDTSPVTEGVTLFKYQLLLSLWHFYHNLKVKVDFEWSFKKYVRPCKF